MYRYAANLASKARVARNSIHQINNVRSDLSRNYAAKDIGFGVEARAFMLKGVGELAKDGKTFFDELGIVEKMKLDRDVSPCFITDQMDQQCVTVSEDEDKAGEKKAIKERWDQIRSSYYDKEKSQERFAKLSQGLGVLKFGGASGAQVGEKRAFYSTKAAVEEGSVPMTMNLRPLSPHLPVYSPQSTSMQSIFHRISIIYLTSIFSLTSFLSLKVGVVGFTNEYVHQLLSFSSNLIPLATEFAALAISYNIYIEVRHALMEKKWKKDGNSS